MIRIYKIIKPTDPMTVYIGKTTKTLKERIRKHRLEAERSQHIKVYQWLDATCKIVLLEDFNGVEELAGEREMDITHEYINNGFTVMNTKLDITKRDPNYYKNQNAKHNARRSPEYVNWGNIICQKAKKEGLTSKEYRIKYNLVWDKPKTL